MKIIKNKKGLTMMELLIVISIIGIMSVLIIPRYSRYKDAKSLSLTKTQIGNDVRRVQNYTFSTVKFKNDFPTGGYGIHFTKSGNYIIFADRNSNHMYDSSADPNVDETVETVALPPGMTVTGLKANWVDLSTSTDFVCVPPYGEIYLNGNNTTSQLEIDYKNASNLSDTLILQRSGYIN